MGKKRCHWEHFKSLGQDLTPIVALRVQNFAVADMNLDMDIEGNERENRSNIHSPSKILFSAIMSAKLEGHFSLSSTYPAEILPIPVSVPAHK